MLVTEQSPSVSPPPGEHRVATDMPLSAFLPCNAVGGLQGTQEAAEQLIPEEGKASGDSSLQQAGGEALKESTRALLSHDLPYAVQETAVHPHLPKGRPGLLKATHLQSLLEQVEGISEGFADDSSTAATNEVFNVASFLSFSWNRPFRKLLQDVVEGELETSIWEDSNDCGGQTSIERPRSFRLVHRDHCVAKVLVDLGLTLSS